MSQFQIVSPLHYSGIFDSQSNRKLSDSEIPDFERERIENFNRRHTLSIGVFAYLRGLKFSTNTEIGRSGTF